MDQEVWILSNANCPYKRLRQLHTKGRLWTQRRRRLSTSQEHRQPRPYLHLDYRSPEIGQGNVCFEVTNTSALTNSFTWLTCWLIWADTDLCKRNFAFINEGNSISIKQESFCLREIGTFCGPWGKCIPAREPRHKLWCLKGFICRHPAESCGFLERRNVEAVFSQLCGYYLESKPSCCLRDSFPTSRIFATRRSASRVLSCFLCFPFGKQSQELRWRPTNASLYKS